MYYYKTCSEILDRKLSTLIIEYKYKHSLLITSIRVFYCLYHVSNNHFMYVNEFILLWKIDDKLSLQFWCKNQPGFIFEYITNHHFTFGILVWEETKLQFFRINYFKRNISYLLTLLIKDLFSVVLFRTKFWKALLRQTGKLLARRSAWFT